MPLDCQKFPLDVEPPKTPRQLHPMDCQDIVIGKVRGDLSNIGKVGFHGVKSLLSNGKFNVLWTYVQCITYGDLVFVKYLS